MDETTRRLAAARENALSGGAPAQVRPEVRASWDRARSRGVHPDRTVAPVDPAPDLVRELTREHRLAEVWPTLLRTIGDAITQPGHLVFVSDPEGRLLQVAGDPATRRNAERARLVPGALWNEEQVGTSGVGTALALGRPFQVRGPEHYLSVAADFSCSAAPIVDPVSGATVGTIDVTYPVASSNALAMPLVAAAARLAGTQLGEQTRRRDDDVRARYVDHVLRRSGVRSALVGADGRVLHASPAGWLPPQWAAELGEDGPMTLPDGQRVDAYPAPLLPGSRAAGIEALRDGLHLRVRERLISRGNAAAFARWIASPHGRDDAFVRRLLVAPDEHARPGE